MSNNTGKKTSLRDLKNQFKADAYFNHPNKFDDEGVDHINISIQSDTKLGKLFDPAYLKVINYPFIGKFNSVMSLWFWVRTSDLDDNMRRLTGHKLKSYAESKGVFGSYVPNFKAIIAYATWIKIKNYPGVINELKQLPDSVKFLSYHIVKASGLRLCTNYAALMISIMDHIVKAVKNGEEPDFDCFVDSGSDNNLRYLSGVLGKVMSPSKIAALKEEEFNLAVEDTNTVDEDQQPKIENVENQDTTIVNAVENTGIVVNLTSNIVIDTESDTLTGVLTNSSVPDSSAVS